MGLRLNALRLLWLLAAAFSSGSDWVGFDSAGCMLSGFHVLGDTPIGEGAKMSLLW